jgi:hypothetical protein
VALDLALAGAAQAQTCRTYPTELGSSTYCSNGSSYMTYCNRLGSTTIIAPPLAAPYVFPRTCPHLPQPARLDHYLQLRRPK